MRTRSLGRTGLQVSEIAFGGIPVMTRTAADAVAVLRRALELGISYFDTARGYGDSEVKMGRALAGRIFDCPAAAIACHAQRGSTSSAS